jgi:hypothetical protein
MNRAYSGHENGENCGALARSPEEGKKLAQQLEVILTEPVESPNRDTEGGQEVEDGA